MLRWETNEFWGWALFRIFFSDRLNLAAITHFGVFVGAEAITAGMELLADARFTKKHVVFWDMRRVASMTLHDTDRAFSRQAYKQLKPLVDAKLAQLFEVGNPINDIHKERSERLKSEPHPNQLKTCSFSDAAEWLGVDEQDLNTFIEQNFDPSE
jgi:hypothetical protein